MNFLQAFRLIGQRSSLIRQEGHRRDAKHLHIHTQWRKENRSLHYGAELPDTATSGRDWTRDTWSWNEYGSPMPLRWQKPWNIDATELTRLPVKRFWICCCQWKKCQCCFNRTCDNLYKKTIWNNFSNIIWEKYYCLIRLH